MTNWPYPLLPYITFTDRTTLSECVYVCIYVPLCVPARAGMSVCVCLSVSISRHCGIKVRTFLFILFFFLYWCGLTEDVRWFNRSEQDRQSTKTFLRCVSECFFCKCPPMTVVTDRWRSLRATTTLSEWIEDKERMWLCESLCMYVCVCTVSLDVLSLSCPQSRYLMGNHQDPSTATDYLSSSIHHWPSAVQVRQHVFHSDLHWQTLAPKCLFYAVQC